MSDDIRIKCSQCGAKMKAPQRTVGYDAKCPKCGAVVQVPGAASEALADFESASEVFDRMSGEPQPKPEPQTKEPSPLPEFETPGEVRDRLSGKQTKTPRKMPTLVMFVLAGVSWSLALVVFAYAVVNDPQSGVLEVDTVFQQSVTLNRSVGISAWSQHWGVIGTMFFAVGMVGEYLERLNR